MNNITRKGYRFVGWYIDPEFTKRINPGGVLPHTVTLYDQWVPEVYSITYDCNGGINSRRNPRRVTVESGLLTLFPAYKKNRQFVGWSYQGDLIEFLPVQITEPITLKAEFKELTTIAFDTDGGGKIQPKSTNEFGFLEPFRDPRRLGYRFKGWYLDPKRIIPFHFDLPLKENITLYAKWEIERFHIQYHLDGGIASRKNPKTYTYFDETHMLLPARKKGYRFVGWFDPRGNPLSEIRERSLGDKEIFAKFEKL